MYEFYPKTTHLRRSTDGPAPGVARADALQRHCKADLCRFAVEAARLGLAVKEHRRMSVTAEV